MELKRMTEEKVKELLEITYWVLTISIAIALSIALVTDAMNHPVHWGVPRLVGLILIGVLAIVWSWLSTLGKEALREMG